MSTMFTPRTLAKFEDASASIVLREIDRAFKNASIALGPDLGGTEGTRRIQFRRYVASLDQRDPQHVDRLGRALGSLISQVAESKIDFLVASAEHDGFIFIDGMFRVKPVPNQTREPGDRDRKRGNEYTSLAHCPSQLAGLESADHSADHNAAMKQFGKMGIPAISRETVGMQNHPTLIVYPTDDLPAGKRFYEELLGVAPYVDSPYYVGFRAGDTEIGLDPHASSRGQTAAIAYWTTAEIENDLKSLLNAGAQIHQDIRDVGGMRIAIVRDPSGNLVGLREPAR